MKNKITLIFLFVFCFQLSASSVGKISIYKEVDKRKPNNSKLNGVGEEGRFSPKFCGIVKKCKDF